MSEQSTKITAVEKNTKVKDPREAELGKRLAKISREAKERKARQQSKAEKEAVNQREITDYIDFRYFIGGVKLVATIGGLYFHIKRQKGRKRNSKQCKRRK